MRQGGHHYVDSFQDLTEYVAQEFPNGHLVGLAERLGCSVTAAAGMWLEHRLAGESMRNFGFRVDGYDPSWSEPPVTEFQRVSWELSRVPEGMVIVHRDH